MSDTPPEVEVTEPAQPAAATAIIDAPVPVSAKKGGIHPAIVAVVLLAVIAAVGYAYMKMTPEEKPNILQRGGMHIGA